VNKPAGFFRALRNRAKGITAFAQALLRTTNSASCGSCVVVCVVTLRSLPVSGRFSRCHSGTHKKGSERARNQHEHCLSVSLNILRFLSVKVHLLNSQRGGQRFDPAQLHQTFQNVCSNAAMWCAIVRACPPRVSLSFSLHSLGCVALRCSHRIKAPVIGWL
jgi:hypothetical protein